MATHLHDKKVAAHWWPRTWQILGMGVLPCVAMASCSAQPTSFENAQAAGKAQAVIANDAPASKSVNGTTVLKQASFPDGSKRLWVHEISQGLPWYAWWTAADEAKGVAPLNHELYPLEMTRYASSDGMHANLARINPAQQVKNAGFNGWLKLQFPSDNGDLSESLANAEAVGGVSVAPCLDVMTEDDTVRLLTQYAASAAHHASAARMVEGGVSKLVVFNYWSRQMNATGKNSWEGMRKRLSDAGVQVFFVGDCGPISRTLDGQFDSYFPVFDALYAFDGWSDSGGEQSAKWNPIIDKMNAHNVRFAGGLMPGYDRDNPSDGGYNDPERTLHYRRMWQKVLDSGCQWNVINTWSDTSERTEVRPSSNWNWTRADLSAWYSAKLGAMPLPARLAGKSNLYVTTPEWVKEGETPVAEALCINDTNGALSTQVQFFQNDSSSAPWGALAAASVRAHDLDAATTQVGAVTSANRPSSRFLRARARLYRGKTLLSEVWSAPVCVYPVSQAMPQVGYDHNKTRVRYYSIPAYKALSGTVGLSLSGNPSTGPNATATVTPPTGAKVRFAEVLQNTLQVQNFFSDPNRTAKVPKTASQDAAQNTAPYGFYVGRVVDEDERVGYSAPVYITPSS